MKRTKTKVDIKQFHNDIDNLSDEEFKKRYPGVDKEAFRGLSDEDIAKAAGGASFSLSFSPTLSSTTTTGVKSTGGITFKP